MILADIDFVAAHSISQGVIDKQPDTIDFSYCLEEDGKILGIGGIRLITPTVAWAWVNMAEYNDSAYVIANRVLAMREWMEKLVQEHGIKRLQAYVDVNFSEAIRLVEHLGFQCESIMKKFIGDGDAWMFVKFF